ncbi:Ubiquitin-40S ribosomal protein S27a, partial [Galemys pyrenaicus]
TTESAASKIQAKEGIHPGQQRLIFAVSLSRGYVLVDESGKINCLHREGPSDECGAGVLMASHFQRYYCGKCLAYCFNKPED